MPYDSLADLPSNVKKLPEKRQRQWMYVWNSAYQSCIKGEFSKQSECESEAFAKANGVVKGAEMPDDLTKRFYDSLIRLEKNSPKANYREATDGADWQCGNCRYYERWSRSCSLVEGTIEPSYVCNLWEGLLPSQKPVGALMDDAGVYTERAFQVFVPTPETFGEMDFSKPGWIPYLPKPGVYQHALYGEVEITKESNQEIIDSINNKIYQESIPLDAEHQSKLSGAVGWISKGRVNDDGTGDAYVEWTPRGQTLLKDGGFKYISPEWFPSWREPASGTVYNNVAAGGAITTRPFFKDKVLRALVASEVVPSPAQKESNVTDEEKKAAEAKAASEKAAADAKGKDDKKDEPKTYTEGSPELQKLIDDAKAEAVKAAEAEAAKAKPDDKPEESTAFTELKNQFGEEKKAREAAEARLAAIEKADRVRKFTDLVAGKGGAGDGAPWVGEAADHVAFLEDLAEKFGEDSETFTKYVERQNAAAAQIKNSALFTEIGSGAVPAAGSPDAKINQLVSAKMKENPKLSEAQAYAEVMETDEAKRIYSEMPARPGGA